MPIFFTRSISLNVALLRVAKLWWNGQADHDLGSIVLVPAIVLLRSGGTIKQEPSFVARDYAARGFMN